MLRLIPEALQAVSNGRPLERPTRKSDGLVYERADVANDGVHPTDSGRRKVADLLLKFFKTDPNAKTWFVKP